jgi:hypothetical protein
MDAFEVHVHPNVVKRVPFPGAVETNMLARLRHRWHLRRIRRSWARGRINYSEARLRVDRLARDS